MTRKKEINILNIDNSLQSCCRPWPTLWQPRIDGSKLRCTRASWLNIQDPAPSRGRWRMSLVGMNNPTWLYGWAHHPHLPQRASSPAQLRPNRKLDGDRTASEGHSETTKIEKSWTQMQKNYTIFIETFWNNSWKFQYYCILRYSDVMQITIVVS